MQAPAPSYAGSASEHARKIIELVLSALPILGADTNVRDTTVFLEKIVDLSVRLDGQVVTGKQAVVVMTGTRRNLKQGKFAADL